MGVEEKNVRKYSSVESRALDRKEKNEDSASQWR